MSHYMFEKTIYNCAFLKNFTVAPLGHWKGREVILISQFQEDQSVSNFSHMYPTNIVKSVN